MAKDFRNASQLPDDFLCFDFAEECPDIIGTWEEFRDKFGEDEAERLSSLIWYYGFSVDSNMVGCREAIEKAAMERLKENAKGTDISNITVKCEEPHWISFFIDGVEFGRGYGMITVNDKYMEYHCVAGEFPMIPQKDEYEDLGCSWIEYGDPEWEDFERVEKALAQNAAA